MIPIYSVEVKLGLDNLIKASGKLIYNAQIKNSNLKIDTSLYSLNKSLAGENDIIDLYSLDSILCSTGWNRNADVFLPDEMWKAKASPENKPFNLNHDPNKIIGHITKSVGVNWDDLSVISDDTAIDALPANYHLFSSAIMYKFLNTDLEEKMKTIIAEIEKGDKWFISMECLFNDFDYALLDSDSKQKIIARNKDTAFLTEYLKAYGGVGEYKGSKIGRVPKNIVFCGKGLVEHPANPNGIIFAKVNKLSNDLVYSNVLSEITNEETVVMSNEVKELQDKIIALEKSIAEGNAKGLQVKIDELIKLVEIKDKEIAESKISLTASATNLVESAKKITELETKLSEVNVKLTAFDLASKNAKRADKLVSDKKVKNLVDAQKIVATIIALDDTAFDTFVATLNDIVEVKPEANPIETAVATETKVPNVPNVEKTVEKVSANVSELMNANYKREKK